MDNTTLKKNVLLPRVAVYAILVFLVLAIINLRNPSCFAGVPDFICFVTWRDIFVWFLLAALFAAAMYLIIRMFVSIQTLRSENMTWVSLFVLGLAFSFFTQSFWLPYSHPGISTRAEMKEEEEKEKQRRDIVAHDIEMRQNLYKVTNFKDEPLYNQDHKIYAIKVSFDITGNKQEAVLVSLLLQRGASGGLFYASLEEDEPKNLTVLPNIPAHIEFRFDIDPRSAGYLVLDGVDNEERFSPDILIESDTSVRITGLYDIGGNYPLRAPVFSDPSLRTRAYKDSDFVSTK